MIGRPEIKFTVITNKILNLRDEALLTRLFLLYFAKSFLGKEDRELKLTILPGEISGIAFRSLAGYRRLRERDRMLEPNSGLNLITNLREQQSHYFKFMNRYFMPATEPGEGVRCKVFFAMFRYWAREEGRGDLLNTSDSAIVQGVKQIKEWKHFEWFRRGSEERQYPAVLKPSAVTEQMANAVKIKRKEGERTITELAYELLEAVSK